MNGRYVYERAATSIIKWFHLAEEDLVGHTLVTMAGETGTCRAIRLDDLHGLCFTFDSHDPLSAEARRFYPVSTIRIHGPKAPRCTGSNVTSPLAL